MQWSPGVVATVAGNGVLLKMPQVRQTKTEQIRERGAYIKTGYIWPLNR